MARDVLTPVLRSGAKREGGLLSKGLKYRKQILPEEDITYTDEVGGKHELSFDRAYLESLKKAFDDKAYDAMPFVLAKDDNSHSMDPERFRGKVEGVDFAKDGEKPGLYATLSFPSKSAARSVIDNPDLGVSVRIKEDVELSDGRKFDAALVHVCGTLDPQVKGMSPWQKVDLSNYKNETEVVDLTSVNWNGVKMPKKTQAGSEIDLSDVDISQLTDEQVDAVLARYAEEVDDALADEDGDDSDDEDGDEEAVDGEEAAADDATPVELSSKAQRQIDLANSRASDATAKANRALQIAADKEWEVERRELARRGVPRAIVDLAEPFLHTVDPKTIDLSNGKKADGSKAVREILKAMEGYINLSGPLGHDVDPDEKAKADEADKAVLDAWAAQAPSS